MLMIVSRRERAIPAARTAPNDEPYSTSRSRSRSYQTRCGMRWTSGCAPVAIDERHTGVSEGNVEIAREYDPCSARNESAGARPSPTAASNIDGVRPSMTIRINFLVACKRTQSGVTLGSAAAQARGQDGDQRRLQITGRWNPRERGEHDCRQADDLRFHDTGATAPQSAGHQLGRPDGAEHPARTPADGLVPLADQESDRSE